MKNLNNKQKAKTGFQGAFKRPCRDCDELYYPAGKHTRYCDDCLKKRLRFNWRKRSIDKYGGEGVTH